jgi:hypothetical protein
MRRNAVLLFVILGLLILPRHDVVADSSGSYQLFLPVVEFGVETIPAAGSSIRRVNIPSFEKAVRYPETAVFWFGRVNSTENYADVRIGYNSSQVEINLSIFDRWLWYDPKPTPASLTSYDAVSVYLQPAGSSKPEGMYRFDAMLSWWEERANFQAAYVYKNGAWTLIPAAFTSGTGWRGNAPNNNSGDDRGWTLNYTIPFSSLGRSGAPSYGETWKLGIVLHDRDSASASPNQAKYWPENFVTGDLQSWGEIHFGLPVFSAPQVPQAGQVSIRHRENGAKVPGAAAGGGTTCGAGLSFWSSWGDTPSPGSVDNSNFNIQNQSDVADWPCFSKYYMTFPLTAVPPGQKILSGVLTLHQMGSSGGGSWGFPKPSLVQVSTILQEWNESTLTWNNAPLPQENVARAWVDAMASFPGWPGIPWQWDISAAVHTAYSSGQPLRIVIYTADDQYHSGKYFVSSYTGDWNERARPSITVSWGR